MMDHIAFQSSGLRTQVYSQFSKEARIFYSDKTNAVSTHEHGKRKANLVRYYTRIPFVVGLSESSAIHAAMGEQECGNIYKSCHIPFPNLYLCAYHANYKTTGRRITIDCRQRVESQHLAYRP
jgi:hypothetical protein